MRNSLTALVERYRIDLSGLAYTGALRDALLVAKIYKRLNAMKMDISEKLKKFAEYAKERYDNSPFACGDDKNARYIRVTASGPRVVSISEAFPCKELFKNGKAVPIRKDHASAVHDLHDKDLHTNERMGKNQPEHGVQAFIIRQSLLDPYGKTALPKLLKIQKIVEELHFVADELKVGNIRSDLIFVGKNGADYFPVFFELKAKITTKSLFELSRQLKDIDDYAKNYHVEFSKIFSMATGVSVESIKMENAVRIAIWPEPKPEQTRARAIMERPEANQKLRGNRSFTIGYKETSDGSGDFTFTLQGADNK